MDGALKGDDALAVQRVITCLLVWLGDPPNAPSHLHFFIILISSTRFVR
jgi:hypothetical protein